MPDVLFQQEAVEKAEQLRKEEETQKVRQMEYAELEKRQTERQKRLESIKKTIAAEQTQLGRAEGTKRALEEQLEKEIAEAQKTTAFMEKKNPAQRKGPGESEDRNSLADQIAQVISFRKNRQKQCEGEIAATRAKVSRRAECIARQKKAEAERKEDHERLQKVRSRLEVLQSDRKRWKEQEEKLLENLEEQRAIWAEQDQQKTGAKSEGRPGDGKEQLKDLVSAETVKKQINEFTGSEIAEKLADAERELWIRSVWEQHWLKQKRKELTEQKQCILAEQEELKKIRQEIQEETQKTEQREQEIPKKELRETEQKAERKALLEKIREKEAQLAGKEETELLEHIAAWEAQKERLEEAQKTAKEELDAIQKKLTEVQAALTAIQALETADSQEQPLPSEIELQEDLRGLSEQKQVLDQRYNEQYHAANTNQNTYDAIRNQQSQMQTVEEEYKWVNALADTACGNVSGKQKIELETYVQMAYFDRILRKANVRFLTMSQGQYELKRQEDGTNKKEKAGLELNVIDHYNGTERSVRTLSGGESFQASLSLALGLSDEIQSYAGGIRLDSMFVDEGFGSLDEESLNQAVKALEGLADGNCLVGIISHVPKLKERIEKKIIVTKNRSRDGVGSRAVIE